MKGRLIFVLSFALALIGASAIATRATETKESKQANQSTAQDKAKPTVHQLIGTVSSVAPSNLVLDHNWKGKEEKTTFVLDSGTKKEGNIEKGSQAIVYYHLENKQWVATEVKVSGSKSEPKKS